MYKMPWKIKSPVAKFAVNFVIFIIFLVITRELYLTFFEERNLFGINFLVDNLVLAESRAIHGILNFLNVKNILTGDLMTFSNGQALRVLRPCSGFRQLLQVLLLFSILPGPIKPRFWFIPVSLIIIITGVILHLVVLSLFVAHKPELFIFAHVWLTKVLFYGILFSVWLYWEEVITRNHA